MTTHLAFVIALLTACTPAINQVARAQLDQRLSALTHSDRRFDSPMAASPQPLAVGQWIKLRQIDQQRRPSLSTYKIVGAQDDAFWLEVDTESYFGSTGMKLLIALGDRTDPTQFALRAAFTRDQTGRVTELPAPVLQMMHSTFQPVLDTLVIRWNELPQEDTTVTAGTFSGCFHGRSSVAVAGTSTASEVWWHPEVPINGLVKMIGVGEPTQTELVDFGREGAQSTF